MNLSQLCNNNLSPSNAGRSWPERSGTAQRCEGCKVEASVQCVAPGRVHSEGLGILHVFFMTVHLCVLCA